MPAPRRVLGSLAAAALLTGCMLTPPAPPAPAGASETASPAVSPSSATPPPTAAEAPTATPAPTAAEAPLRLTVMTYNILTGRNDCAGCRALKAAGRGDELALETRLPVAARKIELAAPDLLGLQENEGPGRLPQQHLADLLDGYEWAEPQSSVPIAVRSDRFRIAESGVTELEEGGQSCRAGDRTDGRYVVWARLTEAATGRGLWVFNTHLHPYDTAACARARAENLDRLVSVIEQRNPGGRLPQLVTGDFNAFGDERRRGFDQHLTAMAGLGLVDSHQVAEVDTSDIAGAASAGWMTAEVAGRQRLGVVRRGGRYLDYVWVPQGSRVESWQVLSGPGVAYRRISGERVPVWTGVMASDHSPVVATLVLPAAGD